MSRGRAAYCRAAATSRTAPTTARRRETGETRRGGRQEPAGHVRTHHTFTLMLVACRKLVEPSSSIENRGQTDRVTTPTRAGRSRRCRWPRSRHAAHIALLSSHSTTPTPTSSRECQRVVQLATGITSISRVGRKDVGLHVSVSGKMESVSVSVSASWNTSFSAQLLT